MLVSMSEILNRAHKEGYAVIAPNVFNLETVRAAVEAASEERSPIILNYGESLEEYTDIYEFGYIAKMVANKYDIPVATNLDHGSSLENCIKAIKAQFTSVMLDRSTEKYEDNVRDTKEIVKIAHAVGVSVEAELGHVGLGINYNVKNHDSLTKPDIAEEYVKETGVDALAIAIGTAHGLYSGEPYIDFKRLIEIKKKVAIPLVLHGGSMTGDEQLSKACRLGINKINIGTELDIDAVEGFVESFQDIKKGWELPQRLLQAKNKFKEKVKYYIRIFGSSNKASL